ncbi:ABC transporter substrate-binding protein [Uliginosibacterium sp. sgz301328]|uniref:ABC transporter substrate-binding protein n=1 Tax=Uliginosibacterium sp. sgz301328 TaxID=3243764 RepID=UPI00359F04B2
MLACLVPRVGSAQQGAGVPRIGFLINGGPPATDPLMQSFAQDFARLGYTDARDIVLEPRFARGQIERQPELAAELVSLPVNVIVALGGPAARAAQKATSNIPIAFSIVTDPVALGLVESMSRPGGNITGVTSLDPNQAEAQIALLKQALPGIERLAILSDQAIPGADASGLAPIERANEAAARAAGLRPMTLKIRGPEDFDQAFASMTTERAQALLVLDVPVSFAHRKRIGELAIAHRLPAMFPGGMRDAAGVLTYGTNVADTWRLLPPYVDRILKGAKPGDLPVSTLSRRERIVNLQSARKIGVEIPPSVLDGADEVIR